MMHSKRRHEGYLLIDNRNSPGVPEALIAQCPFPVASAGAGARQEAAAITCSHCQSVVMLNPLRTRPRAYCPKCDHYICDRCEGLRTMAGEGYGRCVTMAAVLDRLQNEQAKETHG